MARLCCPGGSGWKRLHWSDLSQKPLRGGRVRPQQADLGGCRCSGLVSSTGGGVIQDEEAELQAGYASICARFLIIIKILCILKGSLDI